MSGSHTTNSAKAAWITCTIFQWRSDGVHRLSSSPQQHSPQALIAVAAAVAAGPQTCGPKPSTYSGHKLQHCGCCPLGGAGVSNFARAADAVILTVPRTCSRGLGSNVTTPLRQSLPVLRSSSLLTVQVLRKVLGDPVVVWPGHCPSS